VVAAKSPVKIVVAVVVIIAFAATIAALRVRATARASRITWPASIVASDAWYPSAGVVLLQRGTLVTASLRTHECSTLTSPSFTPADATGHVGWGIWCLEGAQYPVTSSDSGRQWRIAGRYFAAVGIAGAGGEVNTMVATSSSGAFAYSPGGNIVDVTSDAGRRWYAAALAGDISDTPGDAVFTAAGNVEVLVSQRPSTHVAGTAWYATTDHGRVWRLGAGDLRSPAS